jgi:TolB-like protein
MRWRSMILLAALGLPLSAWAQDTRPGVGVLPFERGGAVGADDEDYQSMETGLQQLLITELGINSQLRLVERGQLRQILSEQDLAASGRVDAQTAARIGKIVGARYMIQGGFVDLYGQLTLTARVINVETSEIVKVERSQGQRERLYNLVVELGDKITRGVNLPALQRQALEQREQRDIPADAVRLYMKAVMYQDRGDTERAVQLYSQVVRDFPTYTEAQEALQQLRRG